MFRSFFWLMVFLFSMACCFAQDFVWQAGVSSFFDNNEFDGSKVKSSQTMAGTRFVPQIGMCYQQQHRFFVGLDVMHEFGSDKAIEYRFPLAYYLFENKPFVFYMGAFPRKNLLDKYPLMFFQDSVSNYRPVVNGLFWEIRSASDDYFNVWLDWTSRQSTESRETFFLGWSGRYNFSIFYLQHFIYMFHFAGVMNPQNQEFLHDNVLSLTSIGINLAEKFDFEKFDFNIGFSAGFERNRGSSDGWKTPRGLLSELNVEYRGVGFVNTLYVGQGQQSFYREYQNQLYWGDPAYRASKYDRADFYIYFINSAPAKVKLIYSLHFLEKRMFHQQALYASFNLDNFRNKSAESYRRFWRK